MSRSRLHLLILAAYSLLALALTWPLVAHLSTHVPGVPQWAFDESTFLWNVWYLKHALVDNLSSPLHTELIWYPLGIDLLLYTYNFFHALIAMPLMAAFNLPLASNLALLLSTVLSGYGTFLLVLYLLTAQRAGPRDDSRTPIYVAAFAGGLLYAFAANRAIYATLGHYDMVTTQWIPFYVLMLLRGLDTRLALATRYRAAALAGLFLALNGLAEMITALFLGIFTLIVLAVTLWQRARRGRTAVAQDARPTLTALAILGGVAFLVWSPVLIPILIQFLTDDFSLQGWGEAIPLSADLLGWFTPTILHPLFGGDVVAELRRVQLRALEGGVTGFRDINTVFLGWVSLGLALTGAIAFGRRVSIWIWTALVFGLFTLGPFLQINGRYRFDLDGVEATLPLPFALLHFLPVIKANRAPNRNSVLLMLGLAVLAAYGLYWLWQRLARRGHPARAAAITAILLCALILFEHLAVPLPLSDARIPAVYAQIAADPDPVSVMQLPLGWRNSFGVFGPEATLLQYYQTAHGKPMLGGNISRAPDFKLDYFRQIPFFQTLRDLQFGEPVPPERLQAAQAQAAELMYLYNTGYVILTPPIPQRYPYADHWQDAWRFVKDALPLEPKPFWSEDGIEAYRVIQPAGEDRFRLDLGAPGTYPYRGEGWDAAEADTIYDTPAIWATGAESRLFIPLRNVDPAATYQVTLAARPFAWPGSPPQSVALQINDLALPSQPLGPDWQEVTWQLPGSALLNTLNRLQLTWGYAESPRAVLGGDRTIGATGVQLPVDAELKGFADGGYIALFDAAGAQTDASAGRQGVNVAVLDPASGAVTQQAGFDTTANAYESEALAAFLTQVPAGAPVLVVSHGDATAHLTQAAVDALAGIGAGVTLDELAGQHFAVVGVQGATPGTALVVVDPTEAFAQVSLNRDRRALAAAVDWVEVAPAEE